MDIKVFDGYIIIGVSGWYSFFARSVCAFRMRLLNFIHGEMGNRSFPIGFASTLRPKSPYKPTVRREQEQPPERGSGSKSIARHRNTAQHSGLRSRYRRQTKTTYRQNKYPCVALPSKKYRHILYLPPTAEKIPPKTENCLPPKQLPPYCIAAKDIPRYLYFPLTAKVVCAKNRNTACRPQKNAVLQYRPALVRLENRYRP